MKTYNISFATRAAKLMRDHKHAVGKAVAKQIRVTVPNYRGIDIDAMARNIEFVIDSGCHLLEKQDERKFLATLDMIMDIRNASGIAVSDFAMAALCFFPVTRRLFVSRSENAKEGLAVFEAFEAAMMPMIGRIITNFSKLSETASTMPEGVPAALIFGGLFEDTASFEIFPVEDEKR